MKLTRLRLIGFKSFVEPTDFLIEPGLTGVVGPNGCGKSNLVEALRWVMGETSHKSMRAAEMDDVIFAGNNNRPPRNTAEVAIQIDNDEHEAPAQFNEHDTLDVSRRIEREKGSIYRINGREVRARDVMTLFADASTGSRSPALVHQGRIGEIIQAKPEQRRRVLEEAAGISGLHARRHEAELRLKAAETNLLRVEDVIGQLAGQIDALKRQARQAVRYRNVSAEVRKVEATLYYLRWLGANAEVEDSEQRQGSERSRRRRCDDRAEPRPAKAARLAAEACRRCAKPRRAPPRRCSACSSPATRSTPRKPAPASASPSSTGGSRSSRRTSRASARWSPTPKPRWPGSPRKKRRCATKRGPAPSAAPASMPARPRPTAVVGAAEKTFGELTGALADLTARRNQLTATAREQSERVARIESEIANIEAGLAAAVREPARSRGARGRGRKRAGRGRPRPSRPRSPPKPRTAPRARTSTRRACRWPTPSARCSASTPKPRR